MGKGRIADPDDIEQKKVFWLGANGCEFMTWEGNYQIFVFPTGEYPSPPSEVIQHYKRIETIDDFDEALRTGLRFAATYELIDLGRTAIESTALPSEAAADQG